MHIYEIQSSYLSQHIYCLKFPCKELVFSLREKAMSSPAMKVFGRMCQGLTITEINYYLPYILLIWTFSRLRTHSVLNLWYTILFQRNEASQIIFFLIHWSITDNKLFSLIKTSLSDGHLSMTLLCTTGVLQKASFPDLFSFHSRILLIAFEITSISTKSYCKPVRHQCLLLYLRHWQSLSSVCFKIHPFPLMF